MLLIHFITSFTTSMLFVMITHGDNISDNKINVKREVSLSDIIQGALNFVRPIIRTSESMQSDLMAPRKFQSEQIGGRDAEILGLPKHSTLDDMPICKSNLKICKFITCTARNFQNDESIVNLNLAAQILADTKLRKMIASNPSMLLTICQEQGLSPIQCKLFANTFQFIDRFISTIEPLETDIKKSQRYIIKDDPYYDDSDAPPVPIQPGKYHIGSQTWSVNGNNISNPDLLSQKLQSNEKQNLSESSSHPVGSLLNPFNLPNLNNEIMPIPANSFLKQVSPSSISSPLSSTSSPLLTFPPLIFTFPTVAPMIFQPPSTSLRLDLSSPMNLMTQEMQILMSHFNNNLLSSNIMSLPLSPLMFPDQFKLMNSAGSIRSKRSDDYYDNIDKESDETNSSTSSSIYDTINDNNQQMSKAQKQTINRKGLLDCMKLLKES